MPMKVAQKRSVSIFKPSYASSSDLCGAEDKLPKNSGKPPSQPYDPGSLPSMQQWRDSYHRTKEELSKLGLRFERAPWD